MRRLFAFFLSLGLLIVPGAFAYAQTAAYAEVSAINAQNFPQISALVDVYDANGVFVSGLQPADLTVYEDGQQLEAAAITESAPPAQIVVAINPGPPLAVRDQNGKPRSEGVVSALDAWANSLPADSTDDLSLVSLSGSLINHATAKDWLVSLNSFKPDFRNTTPNLQSLSIALDTVNTPTPQPGMKRAVLFITPHMDDPNIDNTIAPLIQKAVESKIRVFVWFVDTEEYGVTASANAFKSLAQQTNGSFFLFSGKEIFPDLNLYFAPLRHIYTITYSSALNTAGDHTLGLYIETPQGTIPALDKPFSVDVQPPNPFFVAPPLQITRQPPAEDPYNPDILNPTRQELDIIVEFPDGHKRELKRSTLYVDGQVAAENTSAPFDKFVWDLSAYNQSSQHEIIVEVEDVLGLKKSSLGTSVTLTVIQAPKGIQAILVRYRSYVILGAIGLAGVALLVILLRGRSSRGSSTIERVEKRKRLEDPLTQPVAALTGSPTIKRSKTQPRKSPSPSWMQTKPARLPEASAYLIRLTNGGEPASVAPIAVLEKDMTFGTDPVQSVHVLDDPSISPLHARIKQTADGAFMLYDHGSVAGTWVNFEPVTREGRRLMHGDRIHFGQMVYRFDLNQPPAESEPQVIKK
ncbi:MAG: FHA domain-containing protein [Chloroflexota bacterium]